MGLASGLYLQANANAFGIKQFRRKHEEDEEEALSILFGTKRIKHSTFLSRYLFTVSGQR
jgi:hypothetical protein